MNINIQDVQTPSLSAYTKTSTPAPEQLDVGWFNAVLKNNDPASVNSVSLDNKAGQSLTQRSDFLQGLSNQAARALQKVGRHTDPMNMVKSTRAMSAFHLETQLTAKMISKTSQAIEKLTNLS